MDATTLVEKLHDQDVAAVAAVGRVLPELARAVEFVTTALSQQGRLIYVGAGTSGRLGALDAAECPPTFGVSYNTVTAVIAGGAPALRRAVEGAEDDAQAGRQAMSKLRITACDVVCGISASGTARFVQAAIRSAQRVGSKTILITCAPVSQMATSYADLVISIPVGAESVAGSTRMKAGLATKAVLHTLSTASMIRLGKVYDNLMVDVRPTNKKLHHRAANLVRKLTDLSPQKSATLLRLAGNEVKVAVVMHHHGVGKRAAKILLKRHNDRLRPLLPQ